MTTRIIAGLVAALLATLGQAAAARAAEPENPAVSTGSGQERAVSKEEFRRMLAEPLSSNPGCGTVCDYKNPETYYVYWCGMGCEDNWKCSDDKITIYAGEGEEPDIRYSPSCRTGWTKRDGGCYDSHGSLIHVITFGSYYTANFSNRRATTAGPAVAGSCYTRMLSIAGIWGIGSRTVGPGESFTPFVYGY